MKKKQKPWSPEARQRHLEGVRRYQKERKDMEYMIDFVTLARKLGVDVSDLAATLAVLQQRWKERGDPEKKRKMTTKEKEQAIDRIIEERGFIQELVASTMKEINEGKIPHPLESLS